MCDSKLVVPGGVSLPVLRGQVRRYFEERYGREHVVFVFLPSRTRCYARVSRLLPRERDSSEIRHVEKTFEFDLCVGMGKGIMEVPA